MKKLIVYIILICSININAQELLPAAELFIQNWSTTKNVYVKVIPVGFIFNGRYINVPSNHDYRYSAEAARRLNPNITNFVFGGNKKLLKCSSYGNIEFENYFYLSTDNSTHNGIADSLIGIGKYKIEFWNSREENGEDILTSPIDYCYIDFGDFDYPGGDWYTGYNDVWIKYYSDDNIKFQFTGIELPINHECANRDLKIYKQIIGESPCSYSVNKSPNKNGFQTTTETQGLSYLNLPVKATDYFGFSQHLDYRSLFMNLSISSGHNAFLKSGETIYIESDAKFIVSDNAVLTFLPSSTLFIKNGGKFCNNGTVNGDVNIIYERRGISNSCSPSHSPFIGGNITIEDSAIVEFPDSTTITFDSTAVFTMMPNSELRLGKNTKLVFLNGSRINCNNAKITSLDSTDIWDGIYLSGIAYDTLKNCTFQNALNGINITDNYDPFGAPGAVEISDCTFKNSTSTELLNYVYVDNSSNVLVKGCNAVKTGSAGFTAGIIAEYCPAGGVVVCDNNINYVNTGISLLQSSEYIARNVITGYSNTGTGIYLDNSNGTIEYNTVNNFQKSVYGSYSSPYLLKNTLIDAYITNIDLVNSSMPVMKPVISSSTLRWLGGNNTITRATPPPLNISVA